MDIDLHWSNGGTWGGSNPGQYNMPDDNTTPVLADIASRYASNPYVILGIYNEPRDVSWSIWLHGGQVVNEERKKGVFVSYHTPGMQALVNSVRKAGFNNVVSVSGLDWGFDLRGIAEGFAISDSNVMYEAHVYPNKKTESWWDENVSIISAKYPILIGEFGATFDTTKGTLYATPQSFLGVVKTWISKHNYSFSAWSMHPGATPLIKDWCYAPTDYFGALVIPWLNR